MSFPMRRLDPDPFVGELLGPSYSGVRRGVTDGITTYDAMHVDDADGILVRRFPVRVDEPTLERLRADALSLATLQHRLLPAPRAILTAPTGELCFVYPRVEGDELGRRLQRIGKLTGERAQLVARGLAEALSTAHAAGILHLALSPSSVWIDPETSELRAVLDFGLGHIVQSALRSTAPSAEPQLPCPVGYLAPELVRNEGHLAPDAQADQFSVAALLFHTMTGKPPFGKGAARSMIGRIVASQPAPTVGLARDQEKVLLRGLEKRKADRYGDVAALDDALERALGRPVSGVAFPRHTPVPAPAVRTTVARHPRMPVPSLDPALAPTTPAAILRVTAAPAPAPAPSAAATLVPPAEDIDASLDAPPRSRVPLYAAIAGAVALLVVVLALALRRPAPVASPVAPPPPSTVEITIDVDPASSTLTLDGKPVVGGRALVPRSTAVVTLSATAPGYAGFSSEIVPDRDRGVLVRLTPSKPSPPPARPRSTGAGWHPPHVEKITPVSTTPTTHPDPSLRDLRDPFAP